MGRFFQKLSYIFKGVVHFFFFKKTTFAANLLTPHVIQDEKK